MSLWRLFIPISLNLALQAQDVPNTATVDLYRDQASRLGVNLTNGELGDASARVRIALRAPLLADPNLSAAELQSAQTALLRLTDLLAADAERAALANVSPLDAGVPLQLITPGRSVRSISDARLAALRAEAKRYSQPQIAVNPPPIPPPAGHPENLALGKRTRQSSFRFLGSQGGVDGVKTGSFGFYTEVQPNVWWEVDLQRTAPIVEVRIYNSRINPERARTLQVLLSVDGAKWTRVYTHDGSVFGADGQPLRVPVPHGVTARWVRLQLVETNYLHLNEVEVY
ncbi:MAG: discoidin domain-containing protein [Bryobacteraceae bacterium]